ncbi:MAG TPA: hypothetical protein VGB00_14365 [Pyrinomonadaceae bacterium]
MTKREVVWLIIKLIGVYFIYETAMSAWNLIGAIFTLMSLGGSVRLVFAEGNNFYRLIAWSLAMAVFNGWLGWYLIKDGSLLFQILNREESPLSLENLKKD